MKRIILLFMILCLSVPCFAACSEELLVPPESGRQRENIWSRSAVSQTQHGWFSNLEFPTFTPKQMAQAALVGTVVVSYGAFTYFFPDTCLKCSLMELLGL